MKSLNPSVPQFPQMPNGDNHGADLVGSSVRIKWALDRWVECCEHSENMSHFSYYFSNDYHAGDVVTIFLLPFIQCVSYLRSWYSDLHIPTSFTLCFLRNWWFWIFPFPSTPYWPVYPLCFFINSITASPSTISTHQVNGMPFADGGFFPSCFSLWVVSWAPSWHKELRCNVIKAPSGFPVYLEFVTITAFKQFQNVISLRPLLSQERLALIN